MDTLEQALTSFASPSNKPLDNFIWRLHLAVEEGIVFDWMMTEGP
jgi:hypothetical protein